jgi:hypothetical protein
MISKQDEKVIVLQGPGTVSTSATASVKIDTLGFDYACIDNVFPVATATNSSAKWLALSLSESDATVFSNATSIAAFSGTTNSSSSTGFVIAAQNDTTNPQVTRMLVDCRARKRYLFVTYEGGASHSTTVITASLQRSEIAPTADSQRGLNISSVIG